MFKPIEQARIIHHKGYHILKIMLIQDGEYILKFQIAFVDPDYNILSIGPSLAFTSYQNLEKAFQKELNEVQLDEIVQSSISMMKKDHGFEFLEP